MSAAIHQGKGGAERPSLLRQLFASLRRKLVPAVGTGTSPAAAPATVQKPLALSGPALALPSGTTAKPAPAPEPATKPRQISLMSPPGGSRTDHVFLTQDFLNRFRQAVVKGGITAKDPVLPILDLLGEMLLHFTHLTDDLNGDLDGQAKRMAGELRVGVEQVRGLLAEHTKTVERSMDRVAERIAATAAVVSAERIALVRTFGKETEELFRRVVVEQTQARLWTSRITVACLMTGLGLGGYWVGRQAGIEQATAAAQAIQTGAVAAVMHDGLKAAQQWVNLASWNNLNITKATCAPQTAEGGFRLACTYTLWAAPPIPTVPSAP